MQTIFGYSWEDIQRAQQGGRLSSVVDTTKTPTTASEADVLLLQEHGVAGLEKMGFCGVLDRLSRDGLLE
jgi:hypothetical protein